MRLALLHDEVDAVEDLPLLRAHVQVLDFQSHTVVVAFFVRVSGWTRSSSVISFSVRTIDPWTRVQRNFVGHGSWFSWPSREQTSTPSASAGMHSMGATSPSSARTTSAMVMSPGSRASV